MNAGRVLALSGGIGGAKLALGLERTLPAGALTVATNPGDDFEHLGLTICPDLDTVCYTLAGLQNPGTGWGRAGETWTFMRVLGELGGETWFQLGDGDLALHLERTRRLAAGETLSAITADLARRMGVASAITPACDQPLRTTVLTAGGALPFQHYFVRDRCAPVVSGFRFEGVDAARPAPALAAAIADPALRAVVICPSNPFISIDPILAIPGVRARLEACPAPVIAVTPVIGARAVKGPTAKMLAELGLEVSARTVAARYGHLLDGFVLDRHDAAQASGIAVPCLVTDTLMDDLDSRCRLAREVLAFAARLGAA